MAWNADVTRLPAAMHSQYLRHCFLNNDLADGHMPFEGQSLSLRDIRVPVFAVGTVKDHVAPWRSVYKIHRLVQGDVTFALTNGGHNAGIVSEPGHKGRYFQYLTTPHSAPLAHGGRMAGRSTTPRRQLVDGLERLDGGAQQRHRRARPHLVAQHGRVRRAGRIRDGALRRLTLALLPTGVSTPPALRCQCQGQFFVHRPRFTRQLGGQHLPAQHRTSGRARPCRYTAAAPAVVARPAPPPVVAGRVPCNAPPPRPALGRIGGASACATSGNRRCNRVKLAVWSSGFKWLCMAPRSNVDPINQPGWPIRPQGATDKTAVSVHRKRWQRHLGVRCKRVPGNLSPQRVQRPCTGAASPPRCCNSPKPWG